MKKQKLPTIVIIAILTLITSILWAFFDITRGLFKKPDVKVNNEVLVPVNPNLDLETLNLLQSATFFEEGQVTEVIVPTTLPSTEPTIEPSPEPPTEESPVASPSSEIQEEIVP